MSSHPQIPRPSNAESAQAAGSDATKLRLMDAAVRVFAERGFHAASMRSITQLAGTSVSAANYHFGSKVELLRAALSARAAAMNDLRLTSLAKVEAAAAGQPIRVEAILDAYLRPLFERFAAVQALEPEAGAMARAVALRLYVDPPEIVAEIRREVFDPINRRFAEALARTLPFAAASQVDFALEVTVGAWIHFLVANAPQVETAEEMSLERLERMIVFLAAGIEAVVADSGGTS